MRVLRFIVILFFFLMAIWFVCMLFELVTGVSVYDFWHDMFFGGR
jgi:hypothetical protein